MSADPADLLPPGDDAAPAPRPAPRPGAVTCEFCECRLTPTGDVLKLSEKAKKIRDTDGDAAKAATRIADLERQIDDLKTKVKVLSGDGADHSLQL